MPQIININKETQADINKKTRGMVAKKHNF